MDDPTFDAQGDGRTTQDDRAKFVEDKTRPLEGTQTDNKEKDGETPIEQ